MKSKNKQLYILGFMAFLANGDNYAAASLIGNISAELNLEVTTASLSVTAYMLSFGIFTLIFGPLSDRFGKVKIINIASYGTAVFSILGALSFNLPSLVFFRSMNGIFGAGIFPVTMALIGDQYDIKDRQKAIGKIMGLAFLGGATATAIGGTIAYFSSWRYVYLIYGLFEIVLATIIFKTLKKDEAVTTNFNLIKSYKLPFSNFRFMRLVTMLFFVGFSVFGTFTFTGIHIQNITEYNILIVGVILSLFGLGTVLGGRLIHGFRLKFKKSFLFISGFIGFTALLMLSKSTNVIFLSIALFGFGLSFIFIQSTLITTAQEKLHEAKGTTMSLVAFNMFTGAAVGTSVNSILITKFSISLIFYITAFVFLGVGLIATILINRFEYRKELLH